MRPKFATHLRRSLAGCCPHVPAPLEVLVVASLLICFQAVQPSRTAPSKTTTTAAAIAAAARATGDSRFLAFQPIMSLPAMAPAPGTTITVPAVALPASRSTTGLEHTSSTAIESFPTIATVEASQLFASVEQLPVVLASAVSSGANAAGETDNTVASGPTGAAEGDTSEVLGTGVDASQARGAARWETAPHGGRARAVRVGGAVEVSEGSKQREITHVACGPGTADTVGVDVRPSVDGGGRGEWRPGTQRRQLQQGEKGVLGMGWGREG